MTPDNRNDLGKILKQRRAAMGLSVRKLATESGVSVSHLTRIERGERFPSARILRRIAKPLGCEVDELFTRAGYLSPQPSTTVQNEAHIERLAPYVASVLAQEPVEVQSTVIGLLSILKSLARVCNSAEWPEFREYVRRKYPALDEDLISMIEDLIERSADKEERG